jgi:succinate-acetate transporter protein
MSHISMILSAVFMMLMVVYLAPNIFALNRGHILRNIALWLGIFVALTVIYQNFGPGGAHPLFQTPASMTNMRPAPIGTKLPAEDTSDKEIKDGKDSGEQDYTPPKEE